MPAWMKSRTIWMHIITVTVAALALPELTSLMSPNALRIVIAVQGVLGIVLRYLTVKPVSAK